MPGAATPGKYGARCMGQIDTDGQTDGCSVGECPPQEHNNSLRLAKSPTVQLADNEVNSLIPDVADSSPSSGTTGSPMPVSISQIEHFRRIRRLDFVFGELPVEALAHRCWPPITKKHDTHILTEKSAKTKKRAK